MKKDLFNGLSDESTILLNETGDVIESIGIKRQKELIAEESPYSDETNAAFSGYAEFDYIMTLGLKEAFVTRKSLIRDIDLNLFVTCKQKTNFELMNEGFAPYAYDDENAGIVIHHIGQCFDAPFAELTEEEHSKFGNSKLLHDTKVMSWREDKTKLNEFQNEKLNHWKKRANGEYSIIYNPQENEKRTVTPNFEQKDTILKVKRPLEKIFTECSISDLRYISNLAASYILTKEIGATSIEEFVNQKLKNSENLITCPYCQSTEFINYGYQITATESKQRYKCKNCERIFNLFNSTIISGSTFSLI